VGSAEPIDLLHNDNKKILESDMNKSGIDSNIIDAEKDVVKAAEYKAKLIKEDPMLQGLKKEVDAVSRADKLSLETTKSRLDKAAAENTTKVDKAQLDLLKKQREVAILKGERDDIARLGEQIQLADAKYNADLKVV